MQNGHDIPQRLKIEVSYYWKLLWTANRARRLTQRSITLNDHEWSVHPPYVSYFNTWVMSTKRFTSSTLESTSAASRAISAVAELLVFTRTWLRDVRVFAVAIPSVVCLSVVCNVGAPYSGGWSFRQYFFTAVYAGHPLTSVQNFTEIVLREPFRQER